MILKIDRETKKLSTYYSSLNILSLQRTCCHRPLIFHTMYANSTPPSLISLISQIFEIFQNCQNFQNCQIFQSSIKLYIIHPQLALGALCSNLLYTDQGKFLNIYKINTVKILISQSIVQNFLKSDFDVKSLFLLQFLSFLFLSYRDCKVNCRSE